MEEGVKEEEALITLEGERVNMPKVLPNLNEGLLPQIPVRGRLLFFPEFWTHISDTWVQDIVSRGYSLNFLHPRPPLTQGIVVPTIVAKDQEIEDLLRKDVIEGIDLNSPGFYSVFFLVSKKDGGLRHF